MLAYNLGIDKCVSERHIYASQRKLTAGEAAKKLSKAIGDKVLAKEIKELYKVHFGRDPEWHHSGMYKNDNVKTMGRTFFLSDEEVQTIADNYKAILCKRDEAQQKRFAEEERKKNTSVTGFYYTWDYDYGGRYGKKRTYKVLHSYEGAEINTPANFTPCTPEALQSVRKNEGKKYFGWDEPTLSEFTN